MTPTDDELRAFALWCRSNDLRHVLDPDVLRRTAGAYNVTGPLELVTIACVPAEIPTADAVRHQRGAALDSIDRDLLTVTESTRLPQSDAWEALRELDPDAPDPFLMDLEVVRVRWRIAR